MFQLRVNFILKRFHDAASNAKHHGILIQYNTKTCFQFYVFKKKLSNITV